MEMYFEPCSLRLVEPSTSVSGVAKRTTFEAPSTKENFRLTKMNQAVTRPAPESLLAKLNQDEQAKLRVYIGAAPGVGKTYQMLEDAHLLKKQGVDIVVAVVEAHGREDTKAMI